MTYPSAGRSAPAPVGRRGRDSVLQRGSSDAERVAGIGAAPMLGSGLGPVPRGIPLPILRVPVASSEAFFASTRIDGRGRLADRSAVREVGWPPGTPVVFTIDDGALVVVSSERGRCPITRQGHLRVPAPVRHRWRVLPGELFLMVVATERDGLVVYPAARVAAALSATGGRLTEVP